jgi:ZIP family zinc transporter
LDREAISCFSGLKTLFLQELNQKIMGSVLDFAAGAMITASFWSFLAPGIEMAEQLGYTP